MDALTAPVEKERQILEGATRVFGEDGYEGASMSRIAHEAGVSKGTLYNYFDGKAALFAALVQRLCAERLAWVYRDLDDEAPPEETLRRIGMRMLEIARSPHGLMLYRMAVAEAAKFPEVARMFYLAGPDAGMRHLAVWIEGQVAKGRLAVSDSRFAAEQFFALIKADHVMKRRLGLATDASESERERIVDAAVHLFLHGCSAAGMRD